MPIPDWMPPLPEPNGYMRHTPVWAEDSMRQIQADAARAALEQAAKVCKKLPREAAAIRALAKEITP